jgi:hypothetical protein
VHGKHFEIGGKQMKFFSVDSPLYRFLSRVLDILKLNFLWILGSLPVFTIGASTTAAMSVALKLADDEEGYIVKSYFEAYKANFKQGVPMGLIFLVAWYAVYLDFQLFGAVKNNPVILLIIGMVSVFLVIIAMIYSFSLLARYENTVVRTIQNSMDISRKYFGKTLILVILVAAEVLIFQYNSTMIFLGILFGPGFIIYTVAAVSKRVFLQIERVNREGE